MGGPLPAPVAADGAVHAGPRSHRITNAEEVILGRAIDLLDERNQPDGQPTVTDVLKVIEEGPDVLRAVARADSEAGYRARSADLVFTLDLLCTGSLAGVFDQQTSRPVDLDAPAVSVDISRVGAAGDHLLTAAMLCTWAHGYAMVDAAAALAEQHLAPRRSYLAVMDELWRALRGAPGLVEYADTLTRLNRAKGMGTIMITHSLADLDALSSEEDRAKARGFAERCAITVMGGLPPRELARVCDITPLTGPEQELVTTWSAPDSWQPGAKHPGRGKYLIKTGERLGIPVELSLVGAEHACTTQTRPSAWRISEPGVAREVVAARLQPSSRLHRSATSVCDERPDRDRYVGDGGSSGERGGVHSAASTGGKSAAR